MVASPTRASGRGLRAVVTALVVAGALTAGCSNAGTTPPARPATTPVDEAAPRQRDLAELARQRVAAARTAHVSGTFRLDGHSVAFDLVGDRDARAAELIVEQGDGSGPTTYRAVNGAYWMQGGAVGGDRGGRDGWVRIARGDLGRIENLLRWPNRLASLDSLTLPDEPARPTEVDGRSAWALRDPAGTVIDVADDGTPLRFASATDNYTFSEWDAVPPVTAPPRAGVR